MTPIRVLLAATLLAASLAASAQKPEFQKVRLVVRSDADRAAAARHGEVVDDYGSFVIVRLPLPAIEKAHAEGLQFEVVEENVGIGRFRFDPERESPSLPASLADHEDGPEPRYYIVQFRGPIRDEWAANVRAAGIETIQYVPDNALLVRATPSQLARASRGPEVRWSGLYHPAYKLADDLEWLLGKPVKRTQADRQRYRIAVFRSGDLKATVAAIEALGGKVDEVEDVHSLYFRALRVELETAKLADVVSLRDVARVETWHPRVRTDERTNQVIAGNYFGTTVPSPGFASFLVNRGVDGSGITVGLGDDGIDVTETHVAGRVTDDTAIRHGAQAGAEGHGHHDAGIIAGFCTHGDQNGFLYGSGVAPQANLINIPLLRAGYSASDAQSQADVVETTAANGQRGTVSSNSWSYEGLHPGYGTDEAIWDALVLDASSTMPGQQPLAIVFAAGNDGPAASSLTSPIPAKNLVVVGASGNYRPGMTDCNNAGSDIDAVACFSSRGPTTDGRIKPDVLAPGVWVASARAGADALWGNIDAGHRWCGGTSQACPHVAGATALIQQWYRSRTGVLPAPALSKAMLINGAVDPSTTANGAIPNNIEGWGRVNLTNTLSSAPAIFHNEQYVISTPGETYTVTGSVANGSNPFRVTLVWSDPPAAAGANPALVNDLDLEVVIGGQTYRGNVLTNGLSTTGGTADHRNNVESVYLAGVSGAFTITIRATSLGGDGAPGVGDSTDQRFALVVANGTTCPSPLAPTPAAAANGSNRIDVTWNAMPGATSYKVLRATTSGGPYTQVGTPTASPFADTTVTAFTTYFYVVRAVGSSCESDNSSQASATATGTLAAPLSLTATIAG
ncbi:MAG TPA: S8 family serine peptidase, partial [Thermoanaerobaculia bacterium]